MSKTFNPRYEHIELLDRIETYKVNKPPKGIFKTRDTGRFGNQMFEYVFWYLMAMQYGRTFKNIYKPFPAPFDKLPNTVKFSKPMNVGLSKYRERIPGYPMNIKYFAKNRDLIIDALRVPQYKVKYDLVVHVRLDDIFDEQFPEYTVLPFSFYRDCFKSLNASYNVSKFNILIIARPINEFQKKVFKDIVKYIKQLSGSKRVKSQTGTMTEDLTAIMKSKLLIASTSSFWFWPSFLSYNSERVYIPVFGQSHLYYYFADKKNTQIHKNYAVRMIDKNYKIYGFPINLDEKIYEDTIELMYTN